MTLSFGKSKVDVDARGCYRCGTESSHDWGVYETLPVTVGARKLDVTLHICGDCMGKAPPPCKLTGRKRK